MSDLTEGDRLALLLYLDRYDSDQSVNEVELYAVVRTIIRNHAENAWDKALQHIWALNDPAYTVITDTESIHPILTRRDVEQATNENPYRAARQEAAS